MTFRITLLTSLAGIENRAMRQYAARRGWATSVQVERGAPGAHGDGCGRADKGDRHGALSGI